MLFLRGFLISRLDSQLYSASGRFAISLEHGQVAPGGDDGDSDNAVGGQSVGTLGVRLVNGKVAQAAIVDDDGKNRTPTFSRSDVSALASVQPGSKPRTTHLDAAGDYRLEAVAGRDGDVQITGLPLHPILETLARLVTIEAALFAVVLAASGATTALVVRRTLRPLRQVADTALHVSELPLTDAGARLPASIAPPHPTTEVDQVSVAFDHMLEHIRAALATRDMTEERLRRFIADASHELRTPLATIRASAEAATRTPDLPADTTTALARIGAASTRMATLVDDLLLLARLDAGRPLAREAVDLTRLLLEAVDEARTAAPTHRWRLELPEAAVTVTGDQQRLHQLVANFLANARIHTPVGTTVVASLHAERAQVVIAVTDDGPGIPAGQHHDLFARFTRGDVSRTAATGSTGLGLAIARGIAVAHGGEVAVTSEPGRTTFRLSMPVDTQGASTEEPAPEFKPVP